MYRGIQRVKNVRVTHGSSLARSAYPARPVGLARKLNNVMAELSQYEVPFLFCSVGLPNQNSNGCNLQSISFQSPALLMPLCIGTLEENVFLYLPEPPVHATFFILRGFVLLFLPHIHFLFSQAETQ
jgi:hypothetical protein